MWLIYILIAVVLWGIAQIFIKIGFKTTSSLFNNIYSSAIGTIIFVPYALANGVHFEKIWSILLVAIIIAALYLIYYYTIGRGQLSLTGTIIGMYPLVTIILSFLFLHEHPSLFQKIAAIIIISGTVFIALPNKLSDFIKVKNFHWLWWSLLAVVIIGTADFLIKVEINQSDLYTYLFTYGIVTTPVSLITILFDKQGRQLPKFDLKKYLPTLVGAAMLEIGFFLFHLALAQGYVSLITPVSSVYVAITALLAWIFLKEKIDKKHGFGIVLSVIGIILIGIS